jgi:hypothetical protein
MSKEQRSISAKPQIVTLRSVIANAQIDINTISEGNLAVYLVNQRLKEKQARERKKLLKRVAKY